MIRRGLSSPVAVTSREAREKCASPLGIEELLAMPDDRLASVDPLVMNLLVAKGIPALENLQIERYRTLLDHWVSDFCGEHLPNWERHFYAAPHEFENDARFFRLGMICQYLELVQGIEYKLDQRDVQQILYTDPSDLFLNGVLETRQGTCGNLAALHVAFAWRLGLPVSLAAVGAHYILRFDDGERTYNIEATQSGHGGFKSDPDEYLIREMKLSPRAIASGSDLRALSPREMLGVFVGLRARHLQDVGKHLNSLLKNRTCDGSTLRTVRNSHKIGNRSRPAGQLG